jgi:transporter family protein
MWILYACLSAFFAGVTSILSKCGIRKTDSTLATALRTVVVLFFAWGMVFLVGSQEGISQISPKTMLFLILSGLATGASWLCYFRALQLGDINRVVPVDKSSTILSVLFAMLFLGEQESWGLKLICLSLIAAGTGLMIQKKPTEKTQAKRGWLLYAAASAIFAALTSILGKIGIEGVESNLGTAIRTCVVLIMAWGMVLVQRRQGTAPALDRRELGFIALSGLATGASWLFYYMALQKGVVSVVVPIDKLSILVTVAFSALVFHERLSRRSALGLALMTVGTLFMAIIPYL